MPTTNEPLPDYAATVACCGDLQPTLDALSKQLNTQTSPKTMTKLLLHISGSEHLDEPDEDDATETEPPHESPEEVAS